MHRLSVILLPFFLAIVTMASAQELQSGLQELSFGGPETPDGKFSASFTVNEDRVTGKLQVKVVVAENCHIFSITSKYPGGPGKPTVLTLEDGFTGAEITGPFEPDQDFKIVTSEFADDPGEEHHGTVIWTAPIRFADGIEPDSLIIPIDYTAQICVDGPAGSCLPFDGVLEAKSTTAKETFQYEYRPENINAVVRGWVDHTAAQAGDEINLKIEIEPDAGWFIESYAPTPTTDSNPTMIVLNKRNEATVGKVSVSVEPELIKIGDTEKQVHRQPVTWIFPIQLPKKMEEKTYSFSGWLGLRPENENGEGDATAVQFRFSLPIGTKNEKGQNDLVFLKPDNADYGEVGSIAQELYENKTKNAGQFADLSLPAVLGLAFIAGLILNVMPCVLPVIGLKVLSFVQQAGENPRRVLILNLVFAAGIVSVFLLLAAFAAFMGLGWGGLFESQAFTIVMVTVVFAFGLSFLGVWEIPIPGFVAASGQGGAAQKEGYTGAFLKGILTTLLATPCSGPLLIPAVTWAIAQPPAVTFLTFLSLGLGMAFPFIVIGFKPSLVSWLPKPGEWMESFKQLMGFVMIGTAVFFFGPISDKYEMSVLTFLVFVSLACWMAGRISLLQTFPVRMRKWISAVAVAGLGGFIAFYIMVPQHELNWQTFSQTALNEHLAEGHVVFVDFTADW